MFNQSAAENLLIMFLLVPCIALSFWWFIRFINWSVGVNIREVMATIYSNPVAAAIYRGALIFTIGQLVISAYGRFI